MKKNTTSRIPDKNNFWPFVTDPIKNRAGGIKYVKIAFFLQKRPTNASQTIDQFERKNHQKQCYLLTFEQIFERCLMC